jgi:hypothetical protein
METKPGLPIDARGPHAIDILPPPLLASPSDMVHPVFDESTPFWKPGLGDILKHLGWRWILFVPALLVIAVLAAIPWQPAMFGLIFAGGGKLLLISIGIAITAAGKAVGSAIKTRKGPFCIHCGYDLTGLPEGHLCPECGRPFLLRLIEEYRRDPHWFVHRYKNRTNSPIADTPFLAGPVRRKKSRDGT